MIERTATATTTTTAAASAAATGTNYYLIWLLLSQTYYTQLSKGSLSTVFAVPERKGLAAYPLGYLRRILSSTVQIYM